MRRWKMGLGALIGIMAVSGLTWADGGREQRARQEPPIALGTSGSSSQDFRKDFGVGGNCAAATLGAAVSCGGALHVLGSNFGLVPQSSTMPPPAAGESIVQPGLRDTSCKQTGTQVATFVGDQVPLCSGQVDAALGAALPGRVRDDGYILGIGIPCAAPVEATVGMPVLKSGRTTGVTSGVVQSVHVTETFFFGDGLYGCGNLVTFTDNIIVTTAKGYFSDAGDDGALVVTDDTNHNPIGVISFPYKNLTSVNAFADIAGAFAEYCGPQGLQLVGRDDCGASNAAASRLAAPRLDLRQALEAKKRHVARLMSDPAVRAVGVGASLRNADQAALHVYVERGRGTRAPLPAELDGVAVRVFEVDRPAVR